MAGLRVDYEQRNLLSRIDSDAPEWLKIKNSQTLNKRSQAVVFEGVKVPINVGSKKISILIRDVAEGDKESVALPLLPGFTDTDTPTVNLADPAFGECVFDYEGLSDGDVVVFIYGDKNKRASVVYVDESER